MKVQIRLEVMKDYEKESKKVFKEWGIKVLDVVVKEWGFILDVEIDEIYIRSFKKRMAGEKKQQIFICMPGFSENDN